MNSSKLEVSIGKISLKKAIISGLNSSDKKKLLVSILTMKKSEPKVEGMNIAIISVDVYCIAYCLKR